VTQEIRSHLFPNGLTLVAESMDWVESAAFTLVLPAGCSRDPQQQLGLANFTCEMVQRGCGPRDNRRFVEDLDRLGADRSAAVSQVHTSFGAAMLAENLPRVLDIYADLALRPLLPPEQLDEGRLVCLQELQSLEDDLAQKLMQALYGQSYPDPWGRSSFGDRTGIESITRADIEQFFEQNYTPRGAILSVAGKINWDELVEHVDRLWSDWADKPQDPISSTHQFQRYQHIDHDSSQMQIGFAYPTVPYRDPDYFQARGAIGVLSGGMSSRLFTEVRERRGLCYTVYASYHSLLDDARVFCYAGTSTDRAQETLEVMLLEVTKLAQGIDQRELNRLKARIKSALIMQQESSPARCGAMAGDWYHLGRVRTMDEIDQCINDLTCETINKFLHENPPADFMIATLGVNALEAPVAVS
jgi:predicted Zn-dependent peptidase